MRSITGTIIHCTATRAGWWENKTTAEKVAEIKRWHTNKGWSDIGYHFLIDRNGTLAAGRPIERDGAHVRGHNRGTIGVSLFGGHGSNETDDFAENFTAAQDAALRKFLADMQARFGTMPVTGHNEYAAKACPGFNVAKWLRSAPETPAQANPNSAWVNPAEATLNGVRALIAAHDAKH